MYNIYFTKKAEKELNRISTLDSKQLIKKLPLLSAPFSPNLDIKKLVGVAGFYRLRLGKVRVLFEIDEVKKEVWIRKIGYRGSVYRGV